MQDLDVYLRRGVKFRPCIDIHKGKVKQIVGSTLSDIKGSDSTLVTNFESDKSAAEYAALYKEDGLVGGHVIMLGADPLSNESAIGALHAYPVGGGINSGNALSYIEEGASHVIITSAYNNRFLYTECTEYPNVARSHQKSYADKRRKPLEFKVGDRKCLADSDLQVSLEEIKIDDKLYFVEEPVEIVDRQVKKLKRSWIPIVKVRWDSRRGAEFTWEREDQFKAKYPHLFATSSSTRVP
nr:1-(5-phosphoribosyl)-5-[(5-phosphoribosylamino) methylideneamino] imidazole-4-carboxamide isomerase, chloroplastic [Tanacetum cinerariifolium]